MLSNQPIIAIPKFPFLLTVRPRLHNLMLCTLKNLYFSRIMPPLLRVRWSKHMVWNYRDVNVGLLVTLIKVGWSVTTNPIILRKILLSTPSLSNPPQRFCLIIKCFSLQPRREWITLLLMLRERLFIHIAHIYINGRGRCVLYVWLWGRVSACSPWKNTWNCGIYPQYF